MLLTILKFCGLFFFILFLCYLMAELTSFIGKRLAKKHPENPKYRPEEIGNVVQGPYDPQTSEDDEIKENIINEDEENNG